MPNAITAWENVYSNFKFGKQSLKCPSSVANTLQYKHFSINYTQNITLQWMAQNIKIKPDSKCTYCNNTDSITHFLVDW